MNNTRGSYTANVTIFNYLKYQDIQGPWSLNWLWDDDEILLSTVGAKSSNFTLRPDLVQLRYEFRWRRITSGITIVNLPPQTDDDDDDDDHDNGQRNIVPAGDVIPWFREEEAGDLEKSSFSFQISVGRAKLNYNHLPAILVRLNTPNLEYTCGNLIRGARAAFPPSLE
ncbi:PREDICTED: LOW QUALITY PROTEIN: protein COBRA [Camelina sativa]|uniref:LOW QUALITY PROTEIN: protein COBRA n=1 Tax=Camelina sativa TaxID=90675 RepID=A0ABM1RBF7_CAMSA|nr:PREDICTED: LOW QUALITY PROTEIN: protein COBRA [Camelina sativa]